MVARTDLTTDPALQGELVTVRRGTAYYARILNSLSDADLDGPSLLPGWSRRHVVSHVGYNARAITRLVVWANTGVPHPMYESPDARNREIEEGATQPARALRHLSEHAAITLDVEWRDTPQEAWEAIVTTAQGRQVPLTETVWMRTREVWLHAMDLDGGGAFADIPPQVCRRLLGDIAGHWRRQGTAGSVSVQITDDPECQLADFNGGPAADVIGSLTAVTAWAAGRTDALLDRGQGIAPPRWI